jgi:heme exporter protein B
MQKDLVSESRTRDVAFSVLFFAILVIVIFNFAFEPGADTTKLVAPGILWVAITFAGILSFNRSFIQEKEKGCIDGLKLCPIDKEVIYLGKMLGSLIFLLIIEIIILPIFSILFDLPLFMPNLILIAVLATVGLSAVGILFSALSVNTKAREILLPILFFPIVTPLIIAAVKATELVLKGEAIGSMSSWLQILGIFDVVFIVASIFVFEYVIED